MVLMPFLYTCRMTLCVNLAGGHSLRYIDETAVAANIQERGFASDAATSNLERSDLTTHIYEGGFKVRSLFQGVVFLAFPCCISNDYFKKIYRSLVSLIVCWCKRFPEPLISSQNLFSTVYWRIFGCTGVGDSPQNDNCQVTCLHSFFLGSCYCILFVIVCYLFFVIQVPF